MTNDNSKNIPQVMSRIIFKLENAARPDTALLASLRNSAGKNLEAATDVWPFLLENMPEEFLSENGIPRYEEKAIFVSLQLYALCKQGTAANVIVDENYKKSIGASIGNGRTNDQEEALDRRFNAMITASTFDELVYHLRQLVKLVKSKAMMKINFSLLADDLYWYQMGRKKQIMFKWATDYYQTRSNNTDNNEEKRS